MLKTFNIIIFLIILSQGAILSQSYEIYLNDTINKTDNKGNKTGKWILFSDNSLGEKIKVAEGYFINNKKDGKWVTYYSNGGKKSIVEFIDGKPNGEVSIYDENNNMVESGTWQMNKWINSYQLYFPTGALKQQFFFNEKGRREGKQLYYYPNGKIAIEGIYKNGKEDGTFFEYDINGKVCLEKTFNNGVEIPEKRQGKGCLNYEITADSISAYLLSQNTSKTTNNFNTIYNPKKQKTKEGIFQNNRLIDGKTFKYNDKNELTKIELYKGGLFAGFEYNQNPTIEDEEKEKMYLEIQKNNVFHSENLKKREEELEKAINLIRTKNIEIELNKNIINEQEKEITTKEVQIKEKTFENETLAKDKMIKELLLKENNQLLEKQKLDNEIKKFEIHKLSLDKSLKEAKIKSQISENKRKEQEINQQKKLRNIFLIGLLLILCLSFFIYKNYREKKKNNLELILKNKLIEEKNREITDSINYAKRIQYTLLASNDILNRNMDSFIIFHPKDIVSGDFYWATEKNDRFYIAVCDSTGHGVPGAFMSLLNISFLNEAINEKLIKEPNKIFDYVRLKLIENISKDGAQDGMDATLLCFDKKKGKVTYSAANNPPVIVKNGVLATLKADKMPIGKSIKENEFNLYEVDYQKGDQIYLYTDGYADQFGGEKGKKFKYKQLNSIIESNSTKTFKEQKENLTNKFNNWKGNMEQVDDVCIIGLSFL